MSRTTRFLGLDFEAQILLPTPLKRIWLPLIALMSCARDDAPVHYVRLSEPAPTIAEVAWEQPTLVSFWATWCPSCREETEALLDLARQAPSGLRVVTFSQDASLAEVQEHFGRAIPTELHLRIDRDASKRFGITQLPTAILIVRGRMIARFDGPRAWSSPSMRRLLERLIHESSP